MRTRVLRTAVLACTFLSFAFTSAAGDVIMLEFMGLMAARDSLAIEVGKKDDHFGMKVSFGPALTGKLVGIVCEETLSKENDEKLTAAMKKLLESINDPKKTVFTRDDFTTSIGLTFKEYTNVNNIKR